MEEWKGGISEGANFLPSRPNSQTLEGKQL